MKRPVKILLGVAAGAAAVVALSFAVLWIVFPPAKVKDLVLEKAGAALHREVKLESAGLRIFPFVGVSLKGFEVANNPDSGFSKDPLVSLGALEVRLSLLSVIKFQPVVKSIVLSEPRIRVEILPDGRTSLDGLGGPKDTTTQPASDSVKPLTLPFPLTVERIAIEDGSVAWLDRASGQEITLGDIDQEISLATDKSLENVETKGRLDLRDVSVAGTGMPLRKGGIHLSLEHDVALNLPKAVVELRSVKVSLQDVSVEASGRAENVLVNPVLHLKAGTSAPIDLAKLLAEVPKEISPELAKLALAGTLDFQASLEGPLGPGRILPRVDATAHLRGVSASVQGLPAKLSALGVAVHVVGTRTVVIDSTSWLLNGNPGHLALAVDSLPLGVDSTSIPILRQLDAAGSLDLGALAQVAAPFAPGLDTLGVSGILGWKLAGGGPLDPAKPTGLSIAGEATFSKVGSKVPGLPDRVTIDGKASLANTLAALDLAILLGPSDLAVKGSLADWLAMVLPDLAPGKTAQARVAVRSRRIDVDRLLPPADTTTQPESAPLTELPELPPVGLEATFDADLIQAMGLSVQGTSAKVSLQGGHLVQSLSGAVASGTIRQNLTGDLTDRKAPVVDFSADLAGIQIGDLLTAMKPRLPAAARRFAGTLTGTGAVKVTAHSSAPLAQAAQKLSADVTLSLANGQIANLPLVGKLNAAAAKLAPALAVKDPMTFGTLAAHLQLQDGKTLIQDLQIDGSSLGLLAGSGSIGLDQSLDLKLDTHLPEAVSAKLQAGTAAVAAATNSIASSFGLQVGSALPQDDQKRVILSWLVGGTFASPTIKPDSRRVGDLAKGAAATAAGALKAQADAEAARLKAEAQAKANAAAQQAKQQAQAQVQQATQQVKQQAQQATDQAKQRAQDAAKSRLRGLGL